METFNKLAFRVWDQSYKKKLVMQSIDHIYIDYKIINIINGFNPSLVKAIALVCNFNYFGCGGLSFMHIR